MDNLPLYIDKEINFISPSNSTLHSYINFKEINNLYNLNKTILVWSDDSWMLFKKYSFLYKNIKDNKIYVDFGKDYRGKYVVEAIKIINH